MSETLFINDVIEEIKKGNIRIPAFQRGFVWDGERVAHLMDSIYKGYPFGSVLIWRTKTALKTERMLGPYELPEQPEEYPIDYILDGQQRMTSIFGVFQNIFEPKEGEDDSIFNIYYDLTSDESMQDSQFMYVSDNDYDANKHFPLRILFNPPEYRKFLKEMDDSIGDKVDELYQKFTTAHIPVQTFKTDDRASVAIVFERINRLGVELNTFQLLSAWSWSEDFDLQAKFEELEEELESYGFSDLGSDTDLLLRCCAAIIEGDAKPATIINLSGAEVRERFNEIKNGILGAVDYIKANLKAYSIKILPFKTIMIPLSVFFSTDKSQAIIPTKVQHSALMIYMWRVFFSRRFSKSLNQLDKDLPEIKLLKAGEKNVLTEINIDLDYSFFTDNNFSVGNVNSKTLILMLANSTPKNFTDGSNIQLEPVLRECNRKEFHHIYPKGHLISEGFDKKKYNCLANFCFLSRQVNNLISDKKPSVYRSLMPSDRRSLKLILDGALCPIDMFHDDYEKFLEDRSAILVSAANKLMNLS